MTTGKAPAAETPMEETPLAGTALLGTPLAGDQVVVVGAVLPVQVLVVLGGIFREPTGRQGAAWRLTLACLPRQGVRLPGPADGGRSSRSTKTCHCLLRKLGDHPGKTAAVAEVMNRPGSAWQPAVSPQHCAGMIQGWAHS